MSTIPGGSLLTFANCEIFNEDGKVVKVSSIWQTRTTVFIFLRHFGCVSCRAHAVQVWNDRAKYEVNGAQIVFIGNGDYHFIRTFKEDLGIQTSTVYTDPTLAAFRAMGFKRGFLVALGPRSIASGLGLFKKGHRQGAYSKSTGDLWQMGGVLVIKPNGAVAYHYISTALGDYPPEQDVVKKT